MFSLVAFTLVAGLLPGPRLVGPADVYRSAVSDLRNERLSVPRMGYEVRPPAAIALAYRSISRQKHASMDSAFATDGLLLSQEITFIIHPDGRSEERVRGVKGKNCQVNERHLSFERALLSERNRTWLLGII